MAPSLSKRSVLTFFTISTGLHTAYEMLLSDATFAEAATIGGTASAVFLTGMAAAATTFAKPLIKHQEILIDRYKAEICTKKLNDNEIFYSADMDAPNLPTQYTQFKENIKADELLDYMTVKSFSDPSVVKKMNESASKAKKGTLLAFGCGLACSLVASNVTRYLVSDHNATENKTGKETTYNVQKASTHDALTYKYGC